MEMQTKQQQEERRSEEVRSRARNLRANERRADGCQPREMFKISEQLYFCCVAVAGERRREKGELGVSEARGSQSAMPLLGAVAVFWGSLRGLGCIAGAVGGVEVVVGGEGEVLSTGPGACVICMLPWALVQQNSCQAGVVHICAERGGGHQQYPSTRQPD